MRPDWELSRLLALLLLLHTTARIYKHSHCTCRRCQTRVYFSLDGAGGVRGAGGGRGILRAGSTPLFNGAGWGCLLLISCLASVGRSAGVPDFTWLGGGGGTRITDAGSAPPETSRRKLLVVGFGASSFTSLFLSVCRPGFGQGAAVQPDSGTAPESPWPVQRPLFPVLAARNDHSLLSVSVRFSLRGQHVSSGYSRWQMRPSTQPPRQRTPPRHT